MPGKRRPVLTTSDWKFLHEWERASQLAAGIIGADKSDRDPLAHTCLTQLLYQFRTRD